MPGGMQARLQDACQRGGSGLHHALQEKQCAFASLRGLVLMVFVVVGTFRRWSELMGIKTLVPTITTNLCANGLKNNCWVLRLPAA